MAATNILAHAGPKVWAYYHAWWGTPDGPSGRWLSWQHPLFRIDDPGNVLYAPDPERFRGPDVRDIASREYPRLGPYDSLDPAVLQTHVEWAVEAGIDGFIVDWVGRYDDRPPDERTGETDQTDRCLALLLDFVERAYPDFGVFVLVDTHWWRGEPIERTIDDLVYLYDRHMVRPGYTRIDGLPAVAYPFTYAHHSPRDWQALKDAMRADGRDVFIFGDDLAHPELFDALAPHIYPAQGERWSTDEEMIAEAVARVAAASARGIPVMAPVEPGYDDRIVHAGGEYVIPRGGGDHYRTAWRLWRDSGADWIAIHSWNGWFDGTAIEPDRTWGDLYLKLTRAFGDAFRLARAEQRRALLPD